LRGAENSQNISERLPLKVGKVVLVHKAWSMTRPESHKPEQERASNPAKHVEEVSEVAHSWAEAQSHYLSSTCR
jgi:hypothetical protein